LNIVVEYLLKPIG